MVLGHVVFKLAARAYLVDDFLKALVALIMVSSKVSKKPENIE